MDGFLDVPPVFASERKQALARRTHTSLGYRASCRFMAGQVFLEPVEPNRATRSDLAELRKSSVSDRYCYNF